jgi:hypothetical protein
MKESTYFVIGAALMLAAFWFLISKPYNDKLNAALDCMHESGDYSEDGYNVCINK